MTAFLFEIILASIVIVSSTSASFPRCISCQCGSSEQNYTHCIDEPLLKDPTCERWAHCETCKANKTFCITCPPGRIGPTCLESVNTRRKRQNDPDTLNQPRYTMQFGSCPVLERPESGSMRCSQTGRERTCTSRCLPGFHFEGDETVSEFTLRCVGDVWTPQSFFPQCMSGGQCEVEVTGSGFYNCTVSMEGTHCDIACDDRYQGRFFCYPGRSWDPPLPYCTGPKEVERKKATCVDPGIPANGLRVNRDGNDASRSRGFLEGESVIFSCNDGFGLNGKSFTTCSPDGTWSAPLPQCISFGADSVSPPNEVTQLCPRLEVNPNVVMEELFSLDHQRNQGFEPGEELTFRCDRDHDLKGPSVIECLGNGRWSSPPPTCNPKLLVSDNPSVREPLLCPPPEVDPNGEVNEFLLDARKYRESFEPGTELTIQCKEGYVLHGWGTFRCLNTGQWSTPSPKCTLKPPTESDRLSGVRCLNPGRIANGEVLLYHVFDDPSNPPPDHDDYEFPLGTHLGFKCQGGYSLVGEQDSMTCESTGYWSGTKPMCVED